MFKNADKRLASVCKWPFHADHVNEDNVFYTELCAYVTDQFRLVSLYFAFFLIYTFVSKF